MNSLLSSILSLFETFYYSPTLELCVATLGDDDTIFFSKIGLARGWAVLLPAVRNDGSEVMLVQNRNDNRLVEREQIYLRTLPLRVHLVGSTYTHSLVRNQFPNHVSSLSFSVGVIHRERYLP